MEVLKLGKEDSRSYSINTFTVAFYGFTKISHIVALRKVSGKLATYINTYLLMPCYLTLHFATKYKYPEVQMLRWLAPRPPLLAVHKIMQWSKWPIKGISTDEMAEVIVYGQIENVPLCHVSCGACDNFNRNLVQTINLPSGQLLTPSLSHKTENGGWKSLILWAEKFKLEK